MTDIILHQYAESPFSEKVRLLLAYKQQSFKAVEIPVIMPKPDLMPLTGGYRKTPVLQVGADIYCDSALACKLVDRETGGDTIYPDDQLAMITSVANWTDTFFFRVCVTVSFQPRALANVSLLSDPEAAAAFMADRAKLSEGSTALQMDLALAQPYFDAHLRRLDVQLAPGGFLFGDKPTIADFSTYHCLWFVHNNEVLHDLFEPFENVRAWMAGMAAFGPGDMTEISGQDALDIAKHAAPSEQHKLAPVDEGTLVLGETVEVMPIDYGFQPVRGQLQLTSLEEIVVRRNDDAVGDVCVHFPRLGFQVKHV